MGQLVRIQSGNWKKSLSGNWQFEGDPSEVEHYIVAQNNEKIESFTSLIREELVIEPECPIALTYQLPDAMLQGIVSNSQPANIITSEDVEVVMSVQEWTKGVLLCITYGSLNVARYEFLCRTPFIVGNTTYLDGTVSEEVHVANIKGMVGNDVIMCSETLLRHLMSDEMLFLLYRFSFEVEKARGFPLWQGASYENNPDESKRYWEYFNIITDNQLGEGDASDGSTYFKSDWQECEVGPEYWENVSNRNYNQGEAQSETGDGQAGGNCANRDVIMNDEVTVDATPNVVEVDNSSTGSTSNCNQRKPGDTLYNPINVTVADENNEGNNLRQKTYITKDTRVSGGEVGGEPSYVHVTDDSDIPAVTIPVGRERLIIDESSSEIEANEGGPAIGANNPDVVNVGMIFKCREDFKQHMAILTLILYLPPADDLHYHTTEMSRLVRVAKGQWRKSGEGVWRFERDSAVLGHDILVGRNDHVEAVKGMVRGVFRLRAETPLLLTFQLPQWLLEPHGATYPPQNIVTNADVEMMISVHEWNTEPRLCVIFGAEEVATYQFRCRSPFTIGTRNFLADGVTEEQHEAVVLDMVRGKEFVCSQGAMAEIFEESEMVLLYRFSMEIEKAKNSLDLNLGPTIEAADHIVPNVGNTGTGNRIGGDGGRGSLGNTYVVTGFDFPGFHQVATGGRFRTSVPSPTYDPNYYNPHFGALEATPEYWERLMSSSYAVQLQRIYGVPGSEYVGYAPTELNIGTSNVHPFPANHQPITVSSNVSSTDVKPVVEAGSEVNFTKLETSCYKNPVYLEKGESSKQVNEGPTAQLAGVGNNENTLQAPDVEGNTGRNASQG
ncbi:hypothetical protein IGI04_004295 [Brassica rapa subsp. trilocularis]|uniref:Uncharacterized protein n=2 Tax=Brassica rapa subsp. trilocularis TaxID=1813537 RepID=A0ABQ7NCS8_BRACM|nr:hypothetical protein IGI04_004295 [Brassica rapa subsp. trilocularis]